MAFSASEAAFEGFRLARREPKSMAALAAAQLAFTVVTSVLMLPAIASMRAASAAARPASPAATLAAASGFFRISTLVVLPFELIFLAVFSAAVYRAVLRPEDTGLARLRFGADELRLIGLWLLLFLLSVAVMVVVVLVGALVGVGAVAATKSSPMTMGLILVVLYVGLAVFMIWMAVRLSLAGPMTFASRKIQLFTSWRLTKGRFWSLFGCYLLAFVFIVAMSIVFGVFEMVVVVATSGGSFSAAFGSMFAPDMASLHAYFTPARLIMLPIGAAVGAVFLTVGIAPAARAYKEIAGLSPEAQAETFA